LGKFSLVRVFRPLASGLRQRPGSRWFFAAGRSSAAPPADERSLHLVPPVSTRPAVETKTHMPRRRLCWLNADKTEQTQQVRAQSTWPSSNPSHRTERGKTKKGRRKELWSKRAHSPRHVQDASTHVAESNPRHVESAADA
jgi:hypothetical protein